MRYILLIVISVCFVGCGAGETATRPTDYKPAPKGDMETNMGGAGKTLNAPPEPG